jgi:chromosomal replication initiator protein
MLGEIKDKYPEKTVLYISAEIFTQQYIDSVKKNNRNDFIHFYQLIDVLIIDDVQFYPVNLEHRMFFHILITYIKTETSILTSDKAPVDMQDIEQRIISFQMGTVSRITNQITNKNFYLKNILYRDGVEIPKKL